MLLAGAMVRPATAAPVTIPSLAQGWQDCQKCGFNGGCSTNNYFAGRCTCFGILIHDWFGFCAAAHSACGPATDVTLQLKQFQNCGCNTQRLAFHGVGLTVATLSTTGCHFAALASGPLFLCCPIYTDASHENLGRCGHCGPCIPACRCKIRCFDLGACGVTAFNAAELGADSGDFVVGGSLPCVDNGTLIGRQDVFSFSGGYQATLAVTFGPATTGAPEMNPTSAALPTATVLAVLLLLVDRRRARLGS
jgi:hypothetical protein